MNAAYKQIIKATTLFGSVQGLNILLNLVRAKLAAVLLGPAGIGLNGIYNEAREFIHTTTNLGMDQSGTREIAATKGDKTDAVMLTRSWVLLFAISGLLITILFANPLSWMLFSDNKHTWQIVMLSPAVAFSTMTCGEMTILRGMQRLKALATVSLLTVITGIVTTIPFYYIWGIEGIIPALVTMTLCSMLVAMTFSYRYDRPKFCFTKDFLSKGNKMLSIGISFMLAGIVAHVAMLFIQAVLNREGGLSIVGYYNSAYNLCFVYVGVLFSSLSQEYFPRLSSVFSDIAKRNDSIRKQILVTFLLSLPLTVVMYILMPWIIPLLLSDEFLPIVSIAQITILTLPLRAIYLPLAYMPLAAGDSKVYFAMETLSYVIMATGVLGGYHLFGLEGLGYGLALMNMMDLVCMAICVKIRYNK